ncbi:zinc ABC transporter substrate-binding protein [Candidatus Dojkabacteria bacterium]|nr:zinc ABC transporter substrate-binding protein [Candidatus Dojkabacteria bacterium]
MSRRLVFGLVILFSVLFMTSVFLYTGSRSDLDERGKLKIAASIFPLYDFTREIAGDKAEVILILPSGSSPHTFEPTPRDQEKLIGTDAVFVIGHGLDGWAEYLATSISVNTKVVPVDRGIALLESRDEDAGDFFDPHYWLSLTNAGIIVDNITEELTLLDPANSYFYTRNAIKYKEKLFTLRENSLGELSSIRTNKIITFHSAFSYFAQDFGLEVVATIEEYPGKEPTIQYIASVREIMGQHETDVLFREPQLSDSVVMALSEDTGAQIYTIDPEGGGIAGIESYIELIEYNVSTIKKALK